mgnify:CR=1 FL=1
MKNYYTLFALGFLLFATQAQAATLYSQSVTLTSGWNIVSTPRVLDSHSFSATENSTNFDIYILNASSTSGWSTMSNLGQTEFLPLYGYFVNNKTGVDQILTFNYKSGTTPNERLFSRVFTKAGWYSLGVANPTYAITQGAATSTDTNNPTNILSSLQGSDYNMAVDFTAGNFASNADSVAVSSTWDARSVSDGVNKLNDFRDTKGYAVYILNTSSLYSGFQNDSIPQCSDGIDNDSDGFVDFPADGGCSSSSDNSEAPGVPSVAVTSATSSVPSQNISVNVSKQVLGGYDVDITEEPISVQSSVFHFSLPLANLLTSVSLYDANGVVVAGPVDAVADGTWQKVTFTDTVTYPIGKKIYTLKGKVPTAVSNNTTIIASTTPSTDWTSVTGQTTGNSISLAALSTAVTMNTMTVKTASLAVTQSTSPVAQTIIAGGTGVTFANFQFDASQSGEDVRFSSIGLTDTVGGAAVVTNLTGCQLFDGTTALNTGSNVVNPTAVVSTFTFDSSLTVTKGTVKTLTLKCNVASNITGSFTWNMTNTQIGAMTVTGVTSGTSVTATGTTTTGTVQTVGISTLTVSTSPSSPSYAIAAAGTTGNTVGVIRFRATNEAVNLNRIGLTLTNTASSSASDLVQVSIWDGTTQVGTATFTGSNTNATSTLSTPVTLPKDTDKDLMVKADFAQIGSSQPGTQGALVAIDNNATADSTGTQGTGVSSGTTINAIGSTAVSGIRLFKSFPTVALDTLSGTGMADGKLMRFKVTANANGGVGLDQFKFTIATSSGVGVTNINLFGYTNDSYSTGISGFTSGQIQSANLAALTSAAVTIDPSAVISIPAGTTYYFELRGTVAGVATGSSVTTTLLGDSAYPSLATNMGTSAAVVSTGGNLVWSPNATTTSLSTHKDWTNGYGVVGLPSSGLIQSRSN